MYIVVGILEDTSQGTHLPFLTSNPAHVVVKGQPAEIITRSRYKLSLPMWTVG